MNIQPEIDMVSKVISQYVSRLNDAKRGGITITDNNGNEHFKSYKEWFGDFTSDQEIQERMNIDISVCQDTIKLYNIYLDNIHLFSKKFPMFEIKDNFIFSFSKGIHKIVVHFFVMSGSIEVKHYTKKFNRSTGLRYTETFTFLDINEMVYYSLKDRITRYF